MKMSGRLSLRSRLIGAFTICALVVAVSVGISIVSLTKIHESLTRMAAAMSDGAESRSRQNRQIIALRETIAGISTANDPFALQDAETRLYGLEKESSDIGIKRLAETIRQELLPNRTRYISAFVELELARDQISLLRSAQQANSDPQKGTEQTTDVAGKTVGAEERLGKAITGMASAEKLVAETSARVLREMNAIETGSLESEKKVVKDVGDAMDVSSQLVESSKRTQLVLALLAIPFAIYVSLAFSGSLARSVSRAANLATSIRNGDLSQRLEVRSADEIGELIANLNAMADTLEDNERQIKQQVAQLNQVLGEVSVAADNVASGSRQLSGASQTLSHGTTEQASSLEQIASATTQIGAQTKANAENAGNANVLAASCRDLATTGNDQMQTMLDAMCDINESSERIGKIIKVIDDIAFQTNLLALNAAVEAARAGRHGKGFAVVAEEVRSLAGRSSKAAHETAELISGCVAKVDSGMRLAEGSAESLKAIVGSVTEVSDLIGEIAAASDEQAQGVAQVSQGLDQIDGVTHQNMASAEQLAATAQQLTSQAETLRQTLVGQQHQTDFVEVELDEENVALLDSQDEQMRQLMEPR